MIDADEKAPSAAALVKELRLAACGLFNLKTETGDYGYFDSIADRVEALDVRLEVA